MTTSQVCLLLSRELGLPLSERFVNGSIRAWPAGTLPPVVGNRRRWSEEHVDRLREQIRQASAASPARAGKVG